MTTYTTTRRRTLAATGSALAAGFAGCLESNDPQPTDAGDDSSGDHDHDTDHELGHPEARIDVTMESDDDTHHFAPHVVHIEEGRTVTWTLESGAHDTVAYHPDNAELLPSASERRIPDGAQPWASELLRTEGETFERTFEEAGVYDYVCTVVEHGHGPERGQGPYGHHPTHESTGMVGRVIVGWPDPDSNAQPALRTPAAELPEAARDELEGFNERTRTALEHDDDH
ncbi:MAG: cupredoxin domain-containing protein [Natrinema limicola]